MERITAKEVTSMMEALAQVYEQPEVISENEEGFKNGGGNAAMQKYIKNGMSATQARMRVETDGAKYTLQQRAKDKETARVNRDRTIQQAGGGNAAEKARIAYRKANPEKSSPLDPNPSSDDEVNAKFNTRVQGKAALTRLGDGDLEAGITKFRKQQADTKAAADAKAKADADAKAKADAASSSNSGNTPTPSPKPTPTFKVGDRQMSKSEINKEYDRLRYNKDPKVRATAQDFGNTAFKATNKPAIGTTPGGTKFERRTPTTAELRAAKAARAAGKGAEGQIKAAVNTTAGKVTQGRPGSKIDRASVNAAVRSANTPSALNKPAPAGTALATAQQKRLAQKNSVQREVAAVKSAVTPNQQASVKSAVTPVRTAGSPAAQAAAGAPARKNDLFTGKPITPVKSAVPTGNTIKTKVNPDSSMSVTQKRSAPATDKIKKALDIQSADLFDIVKGEFINEGYSEEDTMYMMANLNEEQLQEFLKQLAGVAIRNAKKIPAIKGLVTKVGGMFNKAPTQMPSGQVGALRLRQGQATDAVNRLNQSTAASKAKDATRAATREKTRLNNLDPRAVSDRNAREAAGQVRQRNVEMGRPSWYNPNTPGSKEALKRYYADKRAGVKGLPD